MRTSTRPLAASRSLFRNKSSCTFDIKSIACSCKLSHGFWLLFCILAGLLDINRCFNLYRGREESRQSKFLQSNHILLKYYLLLRRLVNPWEVNDRPISWFISEHNCMFWMCCQPVPHFEFYLHPLLNTVSMKYMESIACKIAAQESTKFKSFVWLQWISN